MEQGVVTINLPDPDIGRCENYRTRVTAIDGYVESVRCLDYEDVPHVCTFPPFLHVASGGGSWISSAVRRPPKRWVKPE